MNVNNAITPTFLVYLVIKTRKPDLIGNILLEFFPSGSPNIPHE